MKFVESSVASQVEILMKKTGGEITSPITITDFTNGVCLAGSPIDEDGAVANDATAIGILLTDVYSTRPIGTIIKGSACVNLANAESNSGLTIADAVKTALPSIIFE